MRVIGVIGGVASGKSRVASLLAQLGAGVLDADRVAHEVLRSREVRQTLSERWGPKILGPDGQIDRGEVAAIVFGESAVAAGELAFLEQVTHPIIGRRLAEELSQLAASGAHQAVVLDAAVMLKSGWDKLCDHIIFVEASTEVRMARASARGWSEKEFTAREAAQESLDLKRERADVRVDNTGSLADTRAALEQFWHNHIEAAPA